MGRMKYMLMNCDPEDWQPESPDPEDMYSDPEDWPEYEDYSHTDDTGE